MELVLNLAWLISCGIGLLAWMRCYREKGANTVSLARGLLVLLCIMVLLFPVISISDDLALSPALTEGVKLQDTHTTPETLVSPWLVPAGWLLVTISTLATRITLLTQPEPRTVSPELRWIPPIEKRPPPVSL